MSPTFQPDSGMVENAHRRLALKNTSLMLCFLSNTFGYDIGKVRIGVVDGAYLKASAKYRTFTKGTESETKGTESNQTKGTESKQQYRI